MTRFTVELHSYEGISQWFIVDNLSSTVIKKYSSAKRASEVAECKNWDEEQEIFAEFG
jgi:hypothetical protein